jgi:hypothetical protein
VLQLQRDLSKVEAKTESLTRWLKTDPDVEPFFVRGKIGK